MANSSRSAAHYIIFLCFHTGACALRSSHNAYSSYLQRQAALLYRPLCNGRQQQRTDLCKQQLLLFLIFIFQGDSRWLSTVLLQAALCLFTAPVSQLSVLLRCCCPPLPTHLTHTHTHPRPRCNFFSGAGYNLDKPAKVNLSSI